MAEFKVTDADKAAIKATVNIFILLLFFVASELIFDFEFSSENIKYFVPVIAVVVGIFYRVSLVVAQRWPKAGYILFGIKEPPVFLAEPKVKTDGP
jgi:hypothetical protein